MINHLETWKNFVIPDLIITIPKNYINQQKKSLQFYPQKKQLK